MVDIYSRRKRSEIMSRIKSSGTTPEQRLHSMLRRVLGHRWRIDSNVQTLPGRPDFLIPSLRLIIFADGCFYHRCPKHGHIPKSNGRYWSPKLWNNYRRDSSSRRRLRDRGYSVWRLWEHSLKGTAAEKTLAQLERRIKKRMLDRNRIGTTP
jgi:DNA mismatch endonuclease (patch repair protein)